ncbi:integrase (plasmid) [Streptomyces sp. HU2014]|uniref:integrase n=1 Tax=Streptomyces sp. HU2014 TaxID=2939414 RepID=UPI00200DC0DD|nr:integrase [Streptomyces sp. HU2014]UQI49854.1 integrase [Streptomyces sp. HU2014]
MLIGEVPLTVPASDTPVIPEALFVDGYTGPVSCYGEDAWSMDPINANPSTERARVLWKPFPASMREEFRYLAWLMINIALPDIFLEGRPPSMRTRQSAATIYRTVLQWRRFAIWLTKRDVTSVTACTDEHFRDYALSLNCKPKANRNTVSAELIGLTRLWMFDRTSPFPLNIPEPPWEREGIDDFLPAASAGGENLTEVLSPETMGPLLIWALRVVDDFAEDILAAWAENRRLTTTAKTAPRTKEGLARLNTYLAELAEHGRPMPTINVNGRQLAASLYIAGLTGSALAQVTTATNKRHRWKEYLAAHPGGCPLPLPINGTVGEMRWTEDIDFDEAPLLMRHLGTACFIVLTYLTGMRPGEVLGLRSGCCPDPDESGQRHVIHGYVYKTAVDEDGNHLSTGELRDVPWVAITPVVSAIRVLERIVPSGELLFGSQFHQFGGFGQRTRVALRAETLRERVEHFVDWASQLARRLDRPHEVIPPDPHGAIGTGRFRRTLAWHIARRPGGLIALAIQYGHMRTAVSAGYASRGRDGIHDLLDIETARATADTLATLAADRAAGGGISGPAARRAILAAGQAPAFEGIAFTARQARKLLTNPTLAVHDNPNAFLTCVYNPDKALCRLRASQATPNLDRCVSACANIARTDHHAAQLTIKADELDKQAVGEFIPEPLAERLRTHAAGLRNLAQKHYRERIAISEEPE